MKIKLLTLLFMVTALHLAKAQRKNPSKFVAIKWAPFSIFDVGNSTLQFATEIKLMPQFSMELGFGSGLGISNLNNGGFNSRTGRRNSKFNLEFRSYIPSDYLQKRYIGIQGFFYPQQYNLSEGFFTSGNSTFNFSSARVKKRSWGLHLLIGSQKKWKSNFMSEVYIGGGLRKVSVEYDAEDAVIASGGSLGFPFVGIDFNDRKVGTRIQPSMVIGLKLGFHVFKKE